MRGLLLPVRWLLVVIVDAEEAETAAWRKDGRGRGVYSGSLLPAVKAALPRLASARCRFDGGVFILD